MKVLLLEGIEEEDYERFVCSLDTGLLYYSIKYRNFLKRVLTNSRPLYLVCYEDQNIAGCLPAFLKYNEAYGNILNALPFYGSTGGVLSGERHCEEVHSSLINAFNTLADEEDAITSTIISSNFHNYSGLYEKYSRYTLIDKRIGQVTGLPPYDGRDDNLSGALMDAFHQKTRNLVRKAMKGGMEVSHSGSIDAVNRLSELHSQNMSALGGIAKGINVFMAIRESFVYDEDYRIYEAEKDGRIIAALLVFFYNCTAEYYTPAVMEEYRSLQPVSLLIFEAMQEAARRGCKYWNWGGTWTTQQGVYHFKSRFGAKDMPYYYYTRERDESMRKLDAKRILAEYPYFYVLPFSALEQSCEASH